MRTILPLSLAAADAALGLQRVARIEAELELRLAAASSKEVEVGLQPIPIALAGVPLSLYSTSVGNAKSEVASRMFRFMSWLCFLVALPMHI